MTRRRLRVDRVMTRALATRRAGRSTRAGVEIVREQGADLPPSSAISCCCNRRC